MMLLSAGSTKFDVLNTLPDGKKFTINASRLFAEGCVKSKELKGHTISLIYRKALNTEKHDHRGWNTEDKLHRPEGQCFLQGCILNNSYLS